MCISKAGFDKVFLDTFLHAVASKQVHYFPREGQLRLADRLLQTSLTIHAAAPPAPHPKKKLLRISSDSSPSLAIFIYGSLGALQKKGSWIILVHACILLELLQRASGWDHYSDKLKCAASECQQE